MKTHLSPQVRTIATMTPEQIASEAQSIIAKNSKRSSTERKLILARHYFNMNQIKVAKNETDQTTK